MKSNVTVVILAAGLGTRMKSKKAKVLHEAGGDTLLNQIIRAALAVARAESIVVVVGHQAERVRDSVHIEDVRFAEQTEQKGTGHAVMCARGLAETAEGQLLILNGDGPLVKPATLRKLVDLNVTGAVGGKIVTTRLEDPYGYGRILRDEYGMVARVVEEKAATPPEREIDEINPGLYCFNAALFWKHIDELKPNPASHEFYLTDMVEIIATHGYAIAPLFIEDETELLGINTRAELAVADTILRARKAHSLMIAGVTIENPASVLIDVDVEVGADSLIEANVQLRGRTTVGEGCRIGAGAVLRDCEIGDGAVIQPYVVAEQSRIGKDAFVGPFARLRMNADAGDGTHIGNFVELKKTRLGAGSKASHLAYLGDAVVGAGVNVGAGAITCNYDGQKKHQTVIEDGVFVGSNSTLVAPLTVGAGSFIGAGSVITKDVEADALALGRAPQTDKAGWAKRRRERKG